MRRRWVSSPNYPDYLGTLGNAYRLSGRTEQAIEAFQAYHARSPGFGLADIVIAYQRTGRPEEARRAAEQLLAACLNFTVAAWLKTQFSHRDTRKLKPMPRPFAPLGFRWIERSLLRREMLSLAHRDKSQSPEFTVGIDAKRTFEDKYLAEP